MSFYWALLFSYLYIYYRLNNTVKYQSIENQTILVPAVLEKNSLLLQKKNKNLF